jgi:hypothetical protein
MMPETPDKAIDTPEVARQYSPSNSTAASTPRSSPRQFNSAEPPGFHESEFDAGQKTGGHGEYDNDDDDVESLYEQDQLPSVDEIRARAVRREGGKTSPSQFKVLLGVWVAVFLTLIIALSVAIPRRNNNGPNEKEASPSLDDDGDLEGYGSLPETENNRTIHVDITKYVADHKYSTIDAATTQGTPQYLAIAWMATADTMKSNANDFDDELLFRERYAAAVLHFAWNPDAWQYDLNFLKGDSHVCDWNSPFESEGVAGIVKVGLVCLGTVGGKQTVNRIFMPSNNLGGEIPPEISLFYNLESIVCTCIIRVVLLRELRIVVR